MTTPNVILTVLLTFGLIWAAAMRLAVYQFDKRYGYKEDKLK